MDYRDQVEFCRINADDDNGIAAFRTYKLLGHPSYILLDPDGTVLWKGQGEQSFEKLEADLVSALEQFSP